MLKESTYEKEEDIRNKYVIFGYSDEETANKLSKFFYKHTGKDVDFNNISHYKSGLRLLLFSIPLKTIQQVGITAACYSPFKKFRSLDEFVNWYEQIYLTCK